MDTGRLAELERLHQQIAEVADAPGSQRLRVLLDMLHDELRRERQVAQRARPDAASDEPDRP